MTEATDLGITTLPTTVVAAVVGGVVTPTSVAATAAATKTATGTLFHGTGFIDTQGTAIQFFAIQAGDSGIRFGRFHLDKTKSTKTAAVTVVNHGN